MLGGYRVCGFFFNDTATTEIYTLSLHDALPIYHRCVSFLWKSYFSAETQQLKTIDRKSTRLNSSHLGISYAVFCLKKQRLNSPTLAIRQEPPRPWSFPARWGPRADSGESGPGRA